LPHGLATNVWLLGWKPSFGKSFYAGVENRFANFLKTYETDKYLDILVYIIRIIGNTYLEKGEIGFRSCFIIKRI
jgi:hypothetical protein